MKEIVEIISLIMGVAVVALVVRYSSGVSQEIQAGTSGLNSILATLLGSGSSGF
ncbi:MAG TPA: hypothetical protein ENO40_04480 [Desulfurella acetivorans]|nr:hypothetical protein [Desulfurella acetivorans]